MSLAIAASKLMTGTNSDSDPRSALERVVLAYERSTHAPGAKRALGSRWTLIDQVDIRGTRYALARYETPRGIGLLTQRERQVLELLAIGHTTKLAAYQLGIAVPTVRVLLVRAVGKLGARNRREAIRRYQDAELPDALTSGRKQLRKRT